MHSTAGAFLWRRLVSIFETVDISADGKLCWARREQPASTFSKLRVGGRIRTIANAASKRVCFASSGSLLATVGGRRCQRVISLWDIANGQLLHSCKEAEGPLTFLSFSSDGQTLVTANTAWQPPSGRPKNWITLWDAATGKERRRIDTGGFGPCRVVISKNNRLAAICRTNMESRLFVWDMQTGNEMWRLDPLPPPPNQPGRPGELNSLTFLRGRGSCSSPGGETICWSPQARPQVCKHTSSIASLRLCWRTGYFARWQNSWL